MAQISLSVPDNETVLRRAAEFLNDVASDLEKSTGPLQTEVLVDELTTPEATHEVTQSGEEDLEPAQEPEDKEEIPAAPEGVDVDSEGLPWDARIHSSGKTKLKGKGTWKLIRGIDPELVESVKAELKKAMAVPVPEAEAPAASEDKPMPPQATQAATEKPIPPASQGGEIGTLPELMSAITANKISVETVLEACKKYDLESVGLLGARVDLIPFVAKDLGL